MRRAGYIYPLKGIVRREYASGYFGCNHGAFSVRLYLSCGHEEVRKGSKEPLGGKARCRMCAVERKP